MSVRLHLLGPPQIESGGVVSALPFERRHQLLALLALRRSWIGRAELAALFWPEQDSRLAYGNLRKTLFRLQALAWAADAVQVQGSALRFEADTDVADFEHALREGRRAAALALWRGELLTGFDDSGSEAWTSWLGFERERLRVAWREAARQHLSGDMAVADGVALSARLLDADPLDEAALQAHMGWLARSGQAARARQVYRDFTARLADDLGLEPGQALKALHDTLASAVPAAAASLAPLPVDDGFVGRTAELRRIAMLFAQPDCRLVCLVGPGGVGKTRLARRAMRELEARHADGAVFVPLDDVASAAELAARVARELGLRQAGRAEPLAQVLEYLRERALLLVLDNAEHLAAADAGSVAALLNACPRLSVLVTSRVRLAIAPEWPVAIEGLPCPEAEDADHLETFDAARLFVQAARRIEPALVPAAEAAAIVDICRQVEGLPLALELAATWIRVLSCDAIAAELRRGTELLHAVDPAQPARHASMEVVFEQSWQRLATAERAALARLSVFRGGFTGEAARAVGAASLPVLGALADKSLLRKDGTRLFMHALVQQFAALKLDAGQAQGATRAHAAYFLRLLAQNRPGAQAGSREALQALDTEFENCRVAWRASPPDENPDTWRRAVLALLYYCEHRARFEEGLVLLHGAIGASSPAAAPEADALLCAAAANLEYRLDRYAAAQALAARALATRTRDHDTRLQCFRVLGACELRLGRNDAARRHYRQALREARLHADAHNAAAILGNLALVAKAEGEYDESLRLSVDSLAQYRSAGDAGGEALCLSNLGSLHGDRGDIVSAEAYLREGLAICERHGLVGTRGLILANLTEIALKRGDPAAAEVHARRALENARSTGNRAVEAWLGLQFVRLALLSADLERARAELATALGLALALGRPSLQIAAVGSFADLLAAQGELGCALRVIVFAAGLPSNSAPERDELLAHLAQWPQQAPRHEPPLELGFDELVRRIVAETGLAHAPLIAALRGT